MIDQQLRRPAPWAHYHARNAKRRHRSHLVSFRCWTANPTSTSAANSYAVDQAIAAGAVADIIISRTCHWNARRGAVEHHITMAPGDSFVFHDRQEGGDDASGAKLWLWPLP